MCFWLLCCVPVQKLFGQHILEFNHLTVENGLSQNTVYASVQDSKGFIWLGTRDGLNRYDSRNIKVYKTKVGDSTSLSWNAISSILSDSKGKLWIGTVNGLNIYNKKSDNFTRLNLEKRDKGKHTISGIYEDKKGNIWLGTNRGLYVNSSAHPSKFRHVLLQGVVEGGKSNDILVVKEDRHSNLWLGTKKGLIKLALDVQGTHQTTFYHNTADSKCNYIRSIEEDQKGNLWIGTEGGLQYPDTIAHKLVYSLPNSNYPSLRKSVRKIKLLKDGEMWMATANGIFTFNSTTKALSNYVNDTDNQKSLNQNSVYDIFQDKSGTIWFGTFYGGVNYIHNYPSNFITYQKSENHSALGSNIISGIAEDDQQNLLIGTQEAGLSYYDRAKGQFIQHRGHEGQPDHLSSDIVKLIYKDHKNNIWIGSQYLQLYNQKTHGFSTFKNELNQPTFINAICEYQESTYWIGTRDVGLYLFDHRTGTFASADTITDHQFRNKVVKYIFKDRAGNSWFGSDAGLFVRNSKTGKLTRYTAGTNEDGTILSDNINVICQDKKQRIWIGTGNGGISLFNQSTQKFTNFTISNGLPSNTINGILEDNDGYLWLSTDKGLCRFDPNLKTTRNYGIEDGLPGNVFNLNSFLKTRNGEFFFGSYNGLVQFNPSRIWVNTEIAPLVFTDVKVANETDKQENDYIRQLGEAKPLITFNHRQNVFTIDFVILNYIKPLKNRYAYKLSGYENNWTYVNVPSVTFTNLPAGTYTLLVKGANNDGVWNPVPLKLIIKVLPPPWLSWWAYTIYAILASGILLLVVRYLLMRDRLKREKEVHQMKLDFFTNVSHELRTPLTLILGPIESLIKNTAVDKQVKDKLSSAKFNADRMLRLVGELLDFRKTETGHLEIHVAKQDIVSFAKKIFLSFKDLAGQREITYNLITSNSSVELYFDDLQFEKVLFNVLSNAFKFTPVGGRIILEITSHESIVELKITDNGIGISAESQAKIFTNYYQVKEFGHQSLGSGIGLALSKSIIELHGGSVAVNSRQSSNREAAFTCFTINMKTGNQHFSKAQLLAEKYSVLPLPVQSPIIQLDGSEQQGISHGRFELLVVEDNEAIRNFIVENLAQNFQITQCANGAEGLEIAYRQIPDLILSDVMMPEMDGLEFSRKIKEDERTSHIPLILLTALSDTIHHIEGLQMGADLYLSKPFSIQVLELSINNLLASRDLMRRKFSQEYTLQPSNVIIDSKDDAFLNKLIALIEVNMTNKAFGVEMLSVDLGMSRNVLYRKIDALTGVSVNEFIKSIRLKRAYQLLELQSYAVYEVAMMVGFNDQKYFSKEFKKCFGQSPSEIKSIK